jgi:glutathione synthase
MSVSSRPALAVQMDPIAGIQIAGDTTFALLLEAQARGWHLFHYTPDRLSLNEGRVIARAEPLQVRDEPGNHYTLDAPQDMDLASMQVILMRQDPPFDMAYLTATYILEHLPQTTLVLNAPKSVRDAPEKLFVTRFPDLMPPTVISRDRAAIEKFRERYGAIVMKPLYGNGGAGVFKLEQNDSNFGSLFDMFRTLFREPWVIQKFLPNVSEGDKRIILLDGIARGAINRVPAPNDIRANLVRGGAALPTDLTPREQQICTTIGPALRESGLYLAGIDVIDGWLTEINVTSPTGLRAIHRLGGPDLSVVFWNGIEKKIGLS